jgi:hypothetical protein
MISGSIANSNGSTSTISIQVIQLSLLEIGLSVDAIPIQLEQKANGEHDRKQIEFFQLFSLGTFYTFIHNFNNEFHKVIGFLRKAKANERVHCESTIADPTVPIVPVARTSEIFRK